MLAAYGELLPSFVFCICGGRIRFGSCASILALIPVFPTFLCLYDDVSAILVSHARSVAPEMAVLVSQSTTLSPD